MDKLIRTIVVMLFFLSMALFSGCRANGMQLTEVDNGRQFTLQSGELLSLKLESNPTTGYSWRVMEIDNAVLIQDGDPEYKQSQGTDGLVGAGGTETFRFETVGSGETTLTLGYMRPWESVLPLEVFSIQIVVQ